MSDFLYYAQSIDDATLTYSATETSGYPIENIQDRNINTFMKDTSVGGAGCNIIIDFGDGITRAVDYFLLGNYKLVSNGNTAVTLQYSATGAWAGEEANAFSGISFESSSLNTKIYTFNSTNVYRYWKIFFQDSNTLGTSIIEIGNIFFGLKWDHNHNPEIGVGEDSGYLVRTNEGEGGIRYSQISNTTVRQQWNYDYKYIIETEKTKFETWIDTIFIGYELSRYPFYFSNDSGTTLYFVRNVGKLNLKEHAYQVYETSITLDEEL